MPSNVYLHRQYKEDATVTPLSHLRQTVDSFQKRLLSDVKIKVDQSAGPEEWREDSLFDRYLVADFTAVLIESINEYNPEVIDKIDLETIVLKSKSKYYSGYYKRAESLMVVEYDTFDFDKNTVEAVTTHEIGHAVHGVVCGVGNNYDKVISSYNSTDYIGTLPDGASERDIANHELRVPKKLVEYGKDREFVRSYSLSNSAEDFATLFQWTLNERGLIRSGDKDFESPLDFKQREMIKVLINIAPGFKEEIEARTNILRLRPTNEINQDPPKILLSEKDLLAIISLSDSRAVSLKGMTNGATRESNKFNADQYCGPTIETYPMSPQTIFSVNEFKYVSTAGIVGTNGVDVSQKGDTPYILPIAVPKALVGKYVSKPETFISSEEGAPSGSRDTRVCQDSAFVLRDNRQLEDYVLVDFTVPLTTSD